MGIVLGGPWIAPTISTIPTLSFTEGESGTVDLSQYVTQQLPAGAVDGSTNYALSGSLGSGLTLTGSVLAYDGVGGTSSGSHQLTVTDSGGSTQSASFGVSVLSSQTITSVDIIGTGTGAVTFGHLFAEGDATAVNISGGQVNAKTTWPDGSLRFAVISGVFTGGGSYGISGGAGSGSNLTEAQLIAALGTTTITLSGGVSGTINAADLISGAATPDAPGKVAWQDGPYCIERIVGKQISGTVYGFFHCRYYSNGALSVDFVIENCEGIAAAANTTASVTAIFVLAGVGQTPIVNVLYSNSRFMETYWNTDPGLHAAPDLTYFYSTKATPKYIGGAATGTYDSSVAWNSTGNLRTSWGATGYGDQIGPLPAWDAAAIKNGFADIDSVIANAKAFNHSSACYKDNSTGYPVDLYTTYSGYSINGWGSAILEGSGTSLTTDTDAKASHSPVIGMMAYVLTGKYYFLETQWYCATNCLLQPLASGTFADRRDNQALTWESEEQRRSAWTIANTARCAFIAPDSITYAGHFETFIANGFTSMYNRYPNGADNNVFGIVKSQGGEWYPTSFRPWMNDFNVGAVLECVRMGFGGTYATEMGDFVAQWVQGRTSYQFDYSFCWRDGPSYSSNDTAPFDGGGWMSSWAEYWSAAGYSDTCSPTGAFSSGDTVTGGYPGNMLYPVAEAHGLGYINDAEINRFMDAFSLADWSAYPVWGQASRGSPTAATALETAATSLTAGYSIKLGTVPASVLVASGESFNHLQWGNSAVYEPNSKKVHWIGKRQSTFSYHWLVYDEATDTWSLDASALPSLGTIGHGYDHMAVDPSTGDVYHRPYNSKTIQKWNGTSWSALTAFTPGMEAVATISYATGLGLFFSSKDTARYYNGSWNELANTGLASNTANHVSAYNSSSGYIIFGGGNQATMLKLDVDTLAMSSIAAPPFRMGIGENPGQGVFIEDPASDKFIGFNKVDNAWTEYDPVADQWNTLTQSTGNGATEQLGTPALATYNSTENAVVAVPISAHGVVMYIQANGVQDGDAWLYKHN